MTNTNKSTRNWPPKKDIYLEALRKAETLDSLINAWIKSVMSPNFSKMEMLGDENARSLWATSSANDFMANIKSTLKLSRPTQTNLIDQLFPDELVAIAISEKVES